MNRSGIVDSGDFPLFESQFGSFLTLPGFPVPIDADLIDAQELQLALQTVVNPLDVNGNGQVSPLDALNIVNRLAVNESTVLDWRYDVNRDGIISPRDALRILNELALQQTSPVASSFALRGFAVPDDDDQDWTAEAIDAVLALGLEIS